MNRPGCFAEFIALPMTNIWRHDPNVDRDAAAIFDPFGNAVHTALSFRCSWRRRSDHRRRTYRYHGRRGGPPCRSALHRDHRPQSIIVWSLASKVGATWP